MITLGLLGMLICPFTPEFGPCKWVNHKVEEFKHQPRYGDRPRRYGSDMRPLQQEDEESEECL